MKCSFICLFNYTVFAVLTPNCWTLGRKSRLQPAASNQVVENDSPVFFGINPNQVLYESYGQTWTAGIAISSKSLIPFTKSPATDMIDRSKKLVRGGYQRTAFELMVDSFEKDISTNKDMIAFYTIKKDDFLQLGSAGYWWAAIFRDGEMIHSTTPGIQQKGTRKKTTLAEFWDIKDNDMLLVTRGYFGHRNEGQIREVVSQAEAQHVSLRELVDLLQNSLNFMNDPTFREIFIAIRMVKSSDQVSEL